MRFRRSVKSLLIISFFVVMLPVDVFLVANNWYAKDVVRLKVSETYRNTLDIFVGQTDRSLKQIDEYLYKLSVLDADTGMLSSLPNYEYSYVLAKVRLQNNLKRDIGFYNLMDTVFFYRGDDIIFSTSEPKPLKYSATQQLLENDIKQFVAQASLGQMNTKDRWMLWHDDLMEGSDFLLKIVEVSPGCYLGAIIRIADILDLLSIQWDYGDIGEGVIYRYSDGTLGERLGAPKQTHLADVVLDQLQIGGERYQMVIDKENSQRYLVMNRTSTMADITLGIFVPEGYLLQGLSYFQKVIYFVEIGIIIIFAAYLYFIQFMLFKPLQQLIIGMKKLSFGILEVRLKTNETEEFIFLANTFNNMAEQIKTLKIGMYEEQLRTQRMEFDQLQAQINPHFYANSLNIIYNFAALKDHDSVKRMALHMADYYRYIMQANRDSISLGAELKHIENYIEIQKFRFPNKLGCEIAVPESLKTLQIPALSLQPFMENAIIHGFVNRRMPFRIEVVVELLEGDGQNHLSLTIQDNGVGFPQELLRLLNKGAPLPEADSSRLGIMNVVQRLKLRYGEGVVVEFSNQGADGGAVIHIQLSLGQNFGTQTEEDKNV